MINLISTEVLLKFRFLKIGIIPEIKKDYRIVKTTHQKIEPLQKHSRLFRLGSLKLS
jgi:hypothetical protein